MMYLNTLRKRTFQPTIRTIGAIFLLTFIFLSSSSSARAQNVASTWFGGIGGWNDNANWTNDPALGGFPNNGSGFTYEAYVAAGKATLASNISISTLSLSGGEIANDFLFSIASLFQWSGGTISGTGITQANRLEIAGPVALNGEMLKFSSQSGSSTWTGASDINIGNGGVLELSTGSTFEVQNNQSIVNTLGGTAAFNNLGTFVKLTGTGTTSISVPFNNSGNVMVNAGTLRFTAGGTNTGNGIIQTSSNGFLEFSGGTFTSSGNGFFTNSNPVRVNGGTLVINNPANPSELSLGAIQLSSGEIKGNRALFFNTLEWAGGKFSGTGVVRTNRLNISGPVELNGQTLRLSTQGGLSDWTGTSDINIGNGGVLELGVGAAFAVTNHQSIVNTLGGTATFNNLGTFTKLNGNGTTTIAVPFNNSGSVQVNAGTLRFTAGGTHTGSGIIQATSSNSFLEFSGGTFTSSGNSFISNGSNPVRINGGMLVINNPQSATELNLGSVQFSSGEIKGNRAVFFNSIDWTGGKFNGTGALRTNQLTISGPAELNGPTLKFGSGTSTWTGTSDINIGNGGVLELSTSSTFTVQNNQSIINTLGGTAAFNNLGTFIKSSSFGTSTGLTTIGVPFNNSGSINVQSGTLRFTAGGTHTGSGAIQATSSNTFLEFSGGTFTSAGTNFFTSLNVVRVNGASLVINNPQSPTELGLGSVQFSSGEIKGNRAIAFNFLDWAGGKFNGTGAVRTNQLTISGPVELNGPTLKFGSGTSTWSGTSDINIGNGGILELSALSTFNVQNNQSMVNTLGGTAAFNNLGNFNKVAGFGTGTTTIAVPFNNSGSINVQSGTLRFTAGGTHTGSGTIQVSSSNSVLEFSGGTFTSTGISVFSSSTNPVRVNGATLVINNPASPSVGSLSSIQFSSGEIKGDRAISMNLLDWSGGKLSGTGGIQAAQLMVTGPVELNGQTLKFAGSPSTWTGFSDINVGNNAVLELSSGGSFEARNNQSIVNTLGGTAAFNNFGNFTKVIGTGTTTINIPFNNSSNVNVINGTLRFAAGGTNTGSGTLNASSSNTSLEFSGGTFTSNANSFTGSNSSVRVTGGTLVINQPLANPLPALSLGPIDFSNGTISGNRPLAISTLNWSGGKLEGTGLVSANTLNITTGQPKLNGQKLLVNGQANWAGISDINVGNGGILEVAAAATFTVQNNQSIVNTLGGTAAFNNFGNFVKNNSTGTTTINVPFNNFGSVDVLSGRVRFAAGGTNTGNMQVSPSSTLEFTGGMFAFITPTSVAKLKVLSGATVDITPTVGGTDYTIAEGGNLIATNLRVNNGLILNGTATLHANGGLAGASKVETLTMGPTAEMNLRDNDLVVGTAANVDAVRAAIKTGVAGSVGITSDLPAFGDTTGFGYALGNDPALSPLLAGSLSGQSYDANSVLVKYTFLGDADLDGDSDLNDLGLWAQSFTGDLGNPVIPVTYWTSGDFDYDGDTDLNDLGFWAGTFTGDLGGGAGSLIVVAPNAPAGAVAALNSMGITVVPEPSTLLLAGVGLAGLTIAARRKRSA